MVGRRKPARTFPKLVPQIQFWRFLQGVIPKHRAFTSGARNLAKTARKEVMRDPSTPLGAGSSLRLKNGCAQDDADFKL